jgi:HSP20 family protein
MLTIAKQLSSIPKHLYPQLHRSSVPLIRSFSKQKQQRQQQQQGRDQPSTMSLFPEYNLFRRGISDMFDDFESSFVPHTHNLLYPLMTDLAAAPLLLEPDQSDKGGEEMKQGEQSTALQQQQPGAMSRFNLRAPVQIRMDVHEDDKQISINAELPGIDKKDIKLSVRDKIVTIEAEKKQEVKEEDKEKRYLRQERVYGKASRTLRLPKYADDSKLNAKFENGVLHITVPKSAEQKPPEQQIQIE